jgi:hypothetical protein
MDALKKSLRGARRQLTLRIRAVEKCVDDDDAEGAEACLSMLKDCMVAVQKLDTNM